MATKRLTSSTLLTTSRGCKGESELSAVLCLLGLLIMMVAAALPSSVATETAEPGVDAGSAPRR
eukprot:scaffold184451_cov29-Prasinocladus_malaysianus.AAC.1